MATAVEEFILFLPSIAQLQNRSYQSAELPSLLYPHLRLVARGATHSHSAFLRDCWHTAPLGQQNGREEMSPQQKPAEPAWDNTIHRAEVSGVVGC